MGKDGGGIVGSLRRAWLNRRLAVERRPGWPVGGLRVVRDAYPTTAGGPRGRSGGSPVGTTAGGPSLDRILAVVAEHFGREPAEWSSGTQSDGIDRAAAAYLARQRFGYPMVAIAKALGYRGHSGVADCGGPLEAAGKVSTGCLPTWRRNLLMSNVGLTLNPPELLGSSAGFRRAGFASCRQMTWPKAT